MAASANRVWCSRPSEPLRLLRLGFDLDAARRQRGGAAEIDLSREHAEADRHARECDALADHEQRDRTFGAEHRVALCKVGVAERDDREADPTEARMHERERALDHERE